MVQYFHKKMKEYIKNDIGFEIRLFSLSVLARIIKLIVDPILMRDSVIYLELAGIWNRTGHYSDILDRYDLVTPPVPIYAIKKMIDWGYGSEIAGRSISVFLGALIPVIGYKIARELTKKKGVPGGCGIILAFHPNLIEYAIQPIRENFYLASTGIAILLLFKAIKNHLISKKIMYNSLCGVFLGISFFSRYETLELLAIITILYFIMLFKTRNKTIILYESVVILSFFIISMFMLNIIDFNISFIIKLYRYFI